MTGTDPQYPNRQQAVEDRQIEHAELLARIDERVKALENKSPAIDDTTARQNRDDGRRGAWELFLGLLGGAGILAFLERITGGQG